jgi:hypothetical protein
MRWCCSIWKEQQYWEGVPDWLLKITEEGAGQQNSPGRVNLTRPVFFPVSSL